MDRITRSLTIGLDLGDRWVEGRVLDETGEVVESFRVRTTEPAMSSRLSSFPPSRVVLEVGTHSPWVSRCVVRHGHEAIVANPRRVRLIAENDAKSDGVDAELLARLDRAQDARRRAARRDRDRDVAAAPERAHLLREHVGVAVVVGDRGERRAVGREGDRRQRRPLDHEAVHELRRDVLRIGRAATVAEEEHLAAGGEALREEIADDRERPCVLPHERPLGGDAVRERASNDIRRGRQTRRIEENCARDVKA